jgi:hypothetical protein
LPWLRLLIDRVLSSADVAVSLNYDCVLEGALDCCGKWSVNGGYGSYLNNALIDNNTPKSPVTVLKIHGSSSFVIAPHFNNSKKQWISSVVNDRFFPRSGKNTHFGYGAGTGKTYVIAPSYVKIPSVQITYLMLDALAASTKAQNLVIIGCSLRPEDVFLKVIVTNFLHQPSWSNRKIIIIDPNAETICDHLKIYWGVNVSSQIVPINDHLAASVDRLSEVLCIKKCVRYFWGKLWAVGLLKKQRHGTPRPRG